MEKWKEAWKNLTVFEKTMLCIRDIGCLCAICAGVLKVLEVLPDVRIAAVMLPIVAIAQAALSWKRNKATALFFLGFLVFFFFVFFLSKG